jgi:Xaa-Pro aminopeptidase
VHFSSSWKNEVQKRRSELTSRLDGGALVLFGASAQRRNSDSEYDFRQESNFLYLTGFVEPDAVLVVRSTPPHTVLFVPPRDRERETWDGRRAGVEGAVAHFGADEAYPITALGEKLADLLENVPLVWTIFRSPELVDPRLTQAIFAVRARRRKKVDSPIAIRDAAEPLAAMRLVKSPFELEQMRVAAHATAEGHKAAMRAARPGASEFELQRVLEDGFRRAGCRHVAYTSIVGAGPNATILHYRDNDAKLPEHGLVLIDAGAEFEGYACDVTRVIPIGGHFSPLERDLYQLVLDAQLAAIAASTVGNTIDQIHERAVEKLEAGLVELGVLTETRDAAGKRLVDKYYMHRTSHYLGLDVHDVGAYYKKGEALPLVPGAVITVEPGLYFAEDDESVDSEFRGIGIRIEDDILISSAGPVVLTADTPKSVEAVEAACLV